MHICCCRSVTEIASLIPLQVDRTERVKNCQDPEFSKKLRLDYHFEKVQKLKLGVYDIDNKSVDLSDDDYLGGFECTLGQVSYLLDWDVLPLHAIYKP